jgi:hypothetical protein
VNGVQLTEAERLVYAAAFAVAVLDPRGGTDPVTAGYCAVGSLRLHGSVAQADDFNPEALAMLRAFRGDR